MFCIFETTQLSDIYRTRQNGTPSILLVLKKLREEDFDYDYNDEEEFLEDEEEKSQMTTKYSKKNP